MPIATEVRQRGESFAGQEFDRGVMPGAKGQRAADEGGQRQEQLGGFIGPQQRLIEPEPRHDPGQDDHELDHQRDHQDRAKRSIEPVQPGADAVRDRAALIRQCSADRPIRAPCASSPSGNAESGSGMPGFLQDGVVESAPMMSLNCGYTLSVALR